MKELVTGIPASPGKGSGNTLVINGMGEVPTGLKKGFVLVTTMTSPVFVPVIKMASAVVTERGGRTCHAGIVCREYGIPCVVGAANAMNILRNEPIITVDGSIGKVYKGLEDCAEGRVSEVGHRYGSLGEESENPYPAQTEERSE